MRVAAMLALAAATAFGRASGQDAAALRSGASSTTVPDSATPSRLHVAPIGGTPAALARLPLWSAPIASALLPGLGQARLGNERSVAYLAAEGYLVLKYAQNTREGRDNEHTFRALARDVARRSFPGSHPDTVFQYYEKLEKFVESGRFTQVINGPTVPETDADTYNGEQWMLARQRFGIPLGDPNPSALPGYRSAIEYYESRAMRQEYGWSWRNAQLEKDLFKRAISRSDAAYRSAQDALIALMANHLLSAIDAFATVRLIQAAAGTMRVSATISLP